MTARHEPDRERTLLLTGGTGFFGRAILRYLVRAKSEHRDPFASVTVLTRSPEAFMTRYPEFSELPWLEYLKGDILSGMDSLLPGRTFTHVLHAAADSTTGPRMGAIERYDQIVQGTRNVLDFAMNAGASRFLFTSSGAVYGGQPVDMPRIPESCTGMGDPMLPENTYGVAKRTAEHLCALYGQKYAMEITVARCFAFVGPDLPLDVHFAIGNFIRDALTEPEIVVMGNGSPLRSYLYQDDLAEWLLEMLDRGRAFAAYNVGSDAAISIADLAHLVRDIVAPNKPVRIMGDPLADEKQRNLYIPDIGLARKELGLDVRVSLTDAIIRTLDGIKRKNTIHG